jgi:predicted enzyme related to lactoylglutathione lyase
VKPAAGLEQAVKFEVVCVPVTDQDRAKAFYQQVGFVEVIDRDMGNGVRWVQLALPGTPTTIALANWFEDVKAGTLRGLFVGSEDFDAEFARLRASGIDIVFQENAPAGRFAEFADLDGNRWTLRDE